VLAMSAGVDGRRNSSAGALSCEGERGPGVEEAEVVAAGGGRWGAELATSARGGVGDFFRRRRPSVRTPAPQHYRLVYCELWTLL
jgi:hypothetical protein